MANQWFRMYSEFAHDPKVQMLSEVDQRRYIMLLCLKCCNGDVTLHVTEVAFQLRISNEELDATKQRLIQKGLVNDQLIPTAWDKRQFISDSSAARVAKFREKQKQGRNVTVTKSNALDTDTDTETEDKETRPKKKSARVKGRESGFDEFWSVVKNKVKRKKALECWVKMNCADIADLVIEVYGHQLANRQQYQDETKIPHPSTWLNNRQWDDEGYAETNYQPPGQSNGTNKSLYTTRNQSAADSITQACEADFANHQHAVRQDGGDIRFGVVEPVPDEPTYGNG